MVYLENRRFLPADSELRKEKAAFPTNSDELQPPPKLKVFEEQKKFHHVYEKVTTRYCKLMLYQVHACPGV